MSDSSFEWDLAKEALNVQKHGVNFVEAMKAFADPNRLIFIDKDHSVYENRFYCIAKVDHKILTVRFVYRRDKIRIIGAGYWRKGKDYYEEKSH